MSTIQEINSLIVRKNAVERMIDELRIKHQNDMAKELKAGSMAILLEALDSGRCLFCQSEKYRTMHLNKGVVVLVCDDCRKLFVSGDLPNASEVE